MSTEQISHSFIESAKNWVCDGYSANIRFIAEVGSSELRIWDASILLNPLPPTVDNTFYVQGDQIYVGQIELNSATQTELVRHLENAQNGIVETPQGVLNLPKAQSYNYYSEFSQRDLWYYQLHLHVVGGTDDHASTYNELPRIDNFLRMSTPPFDGLADVANWLGLRSLDNYNRNPTLDIRVNSPVDLIISESSLSNNSFRVVLHAHPQFNIELVTLAVRGVPGKFPNTRIQIASQIIWQPAQNHRRIGTADVDIEDCDQVLAILLIGNTTVRRQWFIDPDKARNNRLVAVQSFDKNLKMIRSSVLDSSDSNKFENGVAALLFLLGFSSCVQLETDSPDIIVQTPGGRIILVECTLRISDFSAKLGRLVDRRGVLNKELEKSGHYNQIAIALVCRLPRDQIAANPNELATQKAILVTQETILGFFDRLRFPNDPDKMLQDAEAELIPREKQQMELGI